MNKIFEKFLVGSPIRVTLSVMLLLTILGGCAQLDPAIQGTGKQFLEAMDHASAEKDVVAYGELLHDELSYQINVRQQGGQPQNMSLEKSAYLQLLPQSWSSMSDYSIERKNIRVTELDNGNLLLENSYKETITMLQGVRVINNANESITLEVDGVSLKAIEIVANVSMTMQ